MIQQCDIQESKQLYIQVGFGMVWYLNVSTYGEKSTRPAAMAIPKSARGLQFPLDPWQSLQNPHHLQTAGHWPSKKGLTWV